MRADEVIIVLLLMVASLVLVFLGLLTGITVRMRGTSPLVHMVLTYAGLLVTLLSHVVAFGYIIGLRNLLILGPPEEEGAEETSEDPA